MKRIVAALLALLLVAGVTPPLSAKGITTKIRLTGPTLAIPLEITDPLLAQRSGDPARPHVSRPR